MLAGCDITVWSVPSAWGKVFAEDRKDSFGHRLYRPVEHNEHVRQGNPTSMATRSPTLTSEDWSVSATAVTTPEASCPRTRGD